MTTLQKQTLKRGFYSPKARSQGRYPSLLRGAVAAWAPCLGQSGLNLFDTVGSLNLDGWNGTMLPGSDWVLSDGKHAIDLDGTNDFITTSRDLPPPTLPASISAWFYPRSGTQYKSIFRTHYGGTGSNGFFIGVKNDNTALAGFGQSGDVFLNSTFSNYAITTETANANAWNHLVAVISGNNNIKIWINGLLANVTFTGTATTPNTISGRPPSVGRIVVGGNTYYSSCLFDDIIYWRRAITDSEATLLSERRGVAYESLRPMVSVSLITDVTAPTVLSATINVDGDRTTVVHDEAVTGDGTGWQFDDATPLTYVSGAGTDTLVFSHRVILASETRTLEYDDTTGDMEDLADTPNPLESFTGQAVTNNSEAVADETDPELDTQVLSAGATLVLGFDEPVTFTDQTGMSISASGGAVTITGIAGGETNTVTLTLSRSLASTESLSFSYDSGTGDVEDLAGNVLATISNRLVTNNVNNTPGSVSLIGPGLIQ